MDVCFYYIHQVARSWKNLKFVATTTNSLFHAKFKHMYPKFKDDANVIISSWILLSTSWVEVDLVFIPLLPANKAHWKLRVLDIKAHTQRVLKSSTYNDIKVRIGIEPFVSMLSCLMKCVGIWKKDSIELNMDLDFSLPQQKNGHDCGIYMVKYAEYMLYDNIGSMPMKFNAGRARLNVASLLFQYQEIGKARKTVRLTGGESIFLE
ncbi:Ulp1 protease family, C-terminal catalytic domain containing [Olea europaea subsp. europaea]|uniref:Ulp1 protease family, C-terminal catalytic domain containing n=1 Tax=Olea europaea subsp. europaea TaxID=158383 RepID=A0A8S0SNK4_OLEEU|nr:Ulp1 protease family, C-terminal catalytic domain containing [Olea europaea subsp. europaea]